jgi:acetyl-CoA carboxylase biotin carboxyl carrier protein
MKIEEIKELIESVARNGITELEVEQGGIKVKIRKEIPAVTSWGAAPVPPASAVPAGAQTMIAASPAEETLPLATALAVAPAPVEAGDLFIVRSPIVGTFYRAPNPNADPFVKIGDVVEPGKVLCIVEAMKLMNEIEAETGGEIVKIFVENGEPVEFGQSLFGLRPTRKG